MAIDTLWVFLNFLIDRGSNSVNLIDSYIARRLIHMVNKKVGSEIIPYPFTAPNIEYLLPGGGKLGRKVGGYYIKTYSDMDIKHLIERIY